MEIEDRITIIEGPPPTFEATNDKWATTIHDTHTMTEVALTRLRTFNGPALVERCHRAWKNNVTMMLEFRTQDGMPQTAPIVAARAITVDEGDVLLLWVQLNSDEVELELEYDDDESDGSFDDDDGGFDDEDPGDDQTPPDDRRGPLGYY